MKPDTKAGIAIMLVATALAFTCAYEQVHAEEVVIEEEVAVPESRGLAHACDVSGAGAGVKAGGVSISAPTYPCEVQRTYEALDEMDAEGRTGFLAGAARTFLKTRLFTRGIFSSVFGLFGLG